MSRTVLLSASFLLALLLASAAALVVATTKPAEAAFRGRNGDIAFVRWELHHSDDFYWSEAYIYGMRSNGTSQRKLSDTYSYNFDPTWSANGTKIAFTNYSFDFSPADDGDIYMMNADGSNEVNLTKSAADDIDPAWFPSGSKIAFSSDQETYDYNLHTIAFDQAGNVTKTTRLTSDPAGASQPAVSPDGTKIAFVSGRDGDSEIFQMRADGSYQTRLTRNSIDDTSPDWQPLP